ncbi:hypothetical protein L6452_08233 [Arctium lappa]|uniref:Uncharacterized protein n=1 Tax=Arctium lappa TaxID=4217 RepID=A0ACB9DGX9_ARCLA|nr:hypothetical protein L6452_08233 [Arctium lappa]
MGKMSERRKSGGYFGWFIVMVVLGVVAFAVVFTYKKKFGYLPGTVSSKYGGALKVAMQFFDIQKSGKLVHNKIPWRGNSALDDGKHAHVDLSKGMYDAGDHMKFGFPMAFTATVLSWAILEYSVQMNAVNQLQPAKESLKWITDYLINAHPEHNVLYIQVGDPVADHKCWDRPEDMTEKRPLTMVNSSKPGSDVAAETAAALAAASLVFKSSNATYSSVLLRHAQDLFAFADEYRGSYSKSIPQVRAYYDSTGYGDEILWAASWLYYATKDSTYLDVVTGKDGERYANWGTPSWFSWDDKLPGTHVLLSRISFFGLDDDANTENLNEYRRTAEAIMCNLLPNSPSASLSRTEGGLIWVNKWHALQQPVASAFLALVFSDYMLTSETSKLECDEESFSPSDLRKFAKSQADYVLGDNPMKMSYLVGYGSKYPKYVHHRGASIPADAKTGCKDGWKWLKSRKPNPNVATGALVGGPSKHDEYIDSRNNSMQGEPSTYNSAVLVGLLSGLVTYSSVPKFFL